MATMKMLMMLMLAAILFCSHQQVIKAREVVVDGGCSASDKEKLHRCMYIEPLIDKCCPIFISILGTSCPCYKYVEEEDNQLLITIQSACPFDSPCKDVQVIKLSKE
ncbi:unnamed protein product [Withania somnifera]